MAKIVYKNWAAEYGFFPNALVSSFEADAPPSNMLTEHPGQVAILLPGTSNLVDLTFTLGDGSGSSSSAVGRRVDVVAIVNTNAFTISGDFATVTLADSLGGYSTITSTHTNGRTDGKTMTNLIWLASEASGSADLNDIVEVSISFGSSARFGRLDPWAAIMVEEQPFFGTLVAGPAFIPVHGIRLEGYSPGLSDPSQVVQSIGGTRWSARRTRLRRVSAEFALLRTSEIEALPPSLSLRGLVEHCGVSAPALWVLNDDEVGNQSMYAYFAEEVNWSALDKVSDVEDDVPVLAPGYRLSFSLQEAR